MPEPVRSVRHSKWAWGALLLVVLVVTGGAVALLSGGSDSSSSAAAPASASGSVPTASASTSAASLIKRVSDESLLDAGKPAIFFMGAHFCPFCASERWAFVKATARFGTWTGLKPLTSRDGVDGFASLPTYDLTSATFKSSLLSLRHKEVADVEGNNLQSLDQFEKGLVNAYNPQGSIPFVAAGSSVGQYTVELAYSPSLLEGQSFAGLQKAVASNASTPVAKAINGEADAITAMLCKLDGGKPAAVCAAPAITQLGATLG